MRCNCDASCGENRYHNVGDSECRFGSEAEHDAYWKSRYPVFKKDTPNVDTFRVDDVYGYKTPAQRAYEQASEELKDIEEMATFDFGGGCPCGLYRECDPGCREYTKKCDHEHYVVCDNCQDQVKAAMKSPGVSMMEEMPKHTPYIDHMKRPWGEWTVLDVERGFKVKRLEILPDQAISLQYHVHRAEIWNIVQGEGKVIVDGNIFKVSKGDTFVVPKQALHKITNTHLNETLIAIEVQMGEICSEDDIVRC